MCELQCFVTQYIVTTNDTVFSEHNSRKVGENDILINPPKSIILGKALSKDDKGLKMSSLAHQYYTITCLHLFPIVDL